jgi:hypothetical protein
MLYFEFDLTRYRFHASQAIEYGEFNGPNDGQLIPDKTKAPRSLEARIRKKPEKHTWIGLSSRMLQTP